MNFQDLLTASDIRTANAHFPIKTAGTEDCRIQNIHTVGCCHDDDALVVTEAVHLDEHLVQSLFSLIVSASHTGSAASGHGIDLVDEDDTGSVLFRLGEKVTDTGSAHADEHFHEIRTGNAEEGNACLTGHGLGEKGFTGSRRTHQKDTFGDPAPT